MTDEYFLMGEDVSTSPTPSMMNSAFSVLGMEARYSSLSVSRKDFREEIVALKRRGVSGFNITMPYKSEVISLLDHADEVSSRIRAVNTVKREEGRYLGFNTDVDGILMPLKSKGKSPPQKALIIGAGGVARAFCEAMDRLSCRRITVAVRDPGRAFQFSDDMRTSFPTIAFDISPIDALGNEDFDLVFNGSPIGAPGRPLPSSLERTLKGCATVFDAVYNPKDTELIRQGRLNGSEVIRGHEMLLHGDAAAFKILAGTNPPLDVMEVVLLRYLAGGGS